MKPGDAVQISYLEVKQKGSEPFERMLRRFTRSVKDDGILREFTSRRSFVKPSMARRRKRKPV